jgi:hypothetical protein
MNKQQPKVDPLAREPKIPKDEIEMLKQSLKDFASIANNLTAQRGQKLNEIKVINHRIALVNADIKYTKTILKRLGIPI